MRLQAVVFDYGGVLAFTQSPESVARLVEASGLPEDEFLKNYWAHRAAYDSGLSASEYWRTVGDYSPAQVERLTGLDIDSWIRMDQVMYGWASRLRTAGFRTGVISNMPKELGEYLRAKTSGLAGFDHVTLSYEVGVAKPEAAIYHDCLNGLGLPAGQIIFLDDRVENVEAARRAGMQSVVFQDVASFVQEAARLGLPATSA